MFKYRKKCEMTKKVAQCYCSRAWQYLYQVLEQKNTYAFLVKV